MSAMANTPAQILMRTSSFFLLHIALSVPEDVVLCRASAEVFLGRLFRFSTRATFLDDLVDLFFGAACLLLFPRAVS
jgi:hypothetical protein